MKKRLVVTLMAISLVLGGCGSGGGSGIANDTTDSYEASDSSEYEEIEDEVEEYEEDVSEEADTETEGQDVDKVEGIVAMVVHSDSVQIVSIDPGNGRQEIINEFQSNGSGFSGDHGRWIYAYTRSWVSNDFSKIIMTKSLGQDEWHAGWIDTEGIFFDVTEAIGAVKEVDFTNPKPAQQYAVGFRDDMFVFREGEQYYYVSIDNPTAESVTTEWDTWEYEQFSKVQKTDTFYITDKIDDNHYLTDCYGDKGVVYSTIVNTDTNECTSYIPDSERLNWNGVINPNKDKIAFLSLPKNSVEAGAELYMVPIQGGDPISVPITPCEGSLLDTTNLTYFDLFYSEGQYELYLLDWK